MKKWKIFISHGSAFTEAQERFYTKFREFIEGRGCECATIGQNKYGVRQPVELAREAILACDGAAVIAFKRIEITNGTDKPGSSKATPVDGRVLPTVWNHLEGAMAYANHLPLFVIVERGVHREGMLSKRLEWDALEVDISSKVFGTEEFRQRFESWLSFIDGRSQKKACSAVEVDKLTLTQIFQCLTAGQLWAILAAVVAILSFLATVAYKIGAWIATHHT